ncbi:hypothetical protein LCGC14_1371090 [marine sediment metagenome]|uniref:Uncharacterized protein n=1 Tax=marine sediment metagenome TaxID=412755 RepID=A0A0F9KRD3_9ZZZZ
MKLLSKIVQALGLFFIVVVMLTLYVPFILVFVFGILLLIAIVFLIAQLTGKPMEVKEDDVVIGHVQYFKYIPIKKDPS